MGTGALTRPSRAELGGRSRGGPRFENRESEAPGFFLDHQFGSGRTIGGRQGIRTLSPSEVRARLCAQPREGQPFSLDATRPDTEFRSRTFGKTRNEWNNVATESVPPPIHASR